MSARPTAHRLARAIATAANGRPKLRPNPTMGIRRKPRLAVSAGRREQTTLKKRAMVRWVMAGMAAVASLASIAGPAEAYDKGTCDSIFGAANVKTSQFKIDTGSAGKVDFGDLLHLGGVPQGTAVICWQTAGAVAVRGVLFADDINTIGKTEGDVAMRITYFKGTIASGGITTSSKEFGAQNALAGYRTVSDGKSGGMFTKVRIELFRGSLSPATGTLVHTKDFTARNCGFFPNGSC